MKKLVMFILALVTAVGAVLSGSAFQAAEMAQFRSVCVADTGILPRTVPEPVNGIITAAAKYHGTDPLALAVLWHNENGWTFDREPPPPYGNGPPFRTSHKGATGPLQFLRATYKGYQYSNPASQPGNINDLTDALYAAAHFLSDLGGKAGTPLGHPSTPKLKPSIMNAIVSYHSGPAFRDLGPAGRQYIEKGYEAYLSLQAAGGLQGNVENPPSAQPQAQLVATPRGPCGSEGSIAAVNVSADVGKGFPNTDHLPCTAGSDVGIARTAKGNSIRLCSVNGMVVNASIAPNIAQLVTMARAEGINLTGSGFRTMDSQIRLRMKHCGTSQYAIYEMPSRACTPDTAIPGTSQHEQALAIDVAGNYGWMARNAGKVGLKNLPGEPWHYSPSGR